MKKTAIIPLILGLGIGLFTVKLAVDTMRKAQAANAAASVIHVVQAAQDIDALMEITPDMVKLIETTDNSLTPKQERFEEIKPVVGRVTAKSIPANAPILASMLSPPGTPSGIQGRIKPGFRAVSVRIDEVTSVAFQIKPGDWVDVFVVMDVEGSGRGRKEVMSKVILEHVEVAAIGHDTSGSDQTSAGSKVKPAKSATLLIPETDVPKLHLAATRGKLTLAMRGENDLPTSGRPIEARFDENLMGLPTVGESGSNPFWMGFAGALIGANRGPSSDREASKSAAATKKEPEIESRTVMVFRNNSGARGRQIERLTFAGSDSPQILSIRGGGPTGASTIVGSPNSPAAKSSRDSSNPNADEDADDPDGQ